jgi:hypothetical protein
MRFVCYAPMPAFFDQQLLGFLEQRELPYIVVARLPPWRNTVNMFSPDFENSVRLT